MSDEEKSIEGLSLEVLLQLHLNTESCPWTVQNSRLHGQGLFAARRIEEGEVIFRDVALVRGPRSGPSKDPLCVSCLSSSTPLRPCSRSCRLPVCSSNCEISPEHQPECEFLRDHCRQRNESTSDQCKQSGTLDVKGLNQNNDLLKDKGPIAKQNYPLLNGGSRDRQAETNSITEEKLNGSTEQVIDREAQPNSLTKVSLNGIDSLNKQSIDGQNRPNSIKKVEANSSTEAVDRQTQLNGFTEDNINGLDDSTNTSIKGPSHQSVDTQDQPNNLKEVIINGVDLIDGSNKQIVVTQNQPNGSSKQSLNRESQPNGITQDSIDGLTNQRIDRTTQLAQDGINRSTDQRIDRQVEPNGSTPESLEGINLELVRTVTPLRCLQMSKLKRAIMKWLESTEHPVCEIDILKRHLSLPLPSTTEAYLRHCCGTLDTNAYGGTGHGKILNFRGLYALSALMNHSCAPNTTYFFDSESRMVVKAVRRINEGEEILSTYTSLLWGTATRRSFLNNTKTFLCRCVRCRDATEFGTRLSGIRCKARPCRGVLLPSDPLDIKSEWFCDSGQRLHKIGAQKAFQVLNICSKVAEMLTQNEDVSQIRTFLRSVPDNAQSAIQIRKHFVLHAKSVLTDFPDEKLLFKEESCVKLLDLIALLKLGGNYLRGLILKELYLVLQEKSRRFPDDKVEPEVFDKIKAEYETILSS